MLRGLTHGACRISLPGARRSAISSLVSWSGSLALRSGETPRRLPASLRPRRARPDGALAAVLSDRLRSSARLPSPARLHPCPCRATPQPVRRSWLRPCRRCDRLGRLRMLSWRPCLRAGPRSASRARGAKAARLDMQGYSVDFRQFGLPPRAISALIRCPCPVAT